MGISYQEAFQITRLDCCQMRKHFVQLLLTQPNKSQGSKSSIQLMFIDLLRVNRIEQLRQDISTEFCINILQANNQVRMLMI